ncbi:hypothetical protein LQ757_12290 [Agromyces sp. SYSU K20354]|uniref:hypothetical protein n=1 Tax=Agromyces cavernae TaxID=2898659 RepID=UPI001E4AAD7A|nr:hypothetical protein [Agromyces cavernae]MCD2443053.1 hypothetical protein [Agromyces cavernae]
MTMSPDCTCTGSSSVTICSCVLPPARRSHSTVCGPLNVAPASPLPSMMRSPVSTVRASATDDQLAGYTPTSTIHPSVVTVSDCPTSIQETARGKWLQRS